MGLQSYARKRNFKVTPEPGVRAKGPARASPSKDARFVVQKHAASHLHYDLRLEVDGVLKSWAVPKGPSLDPREKRLAVEVEDHPLAYGDFEGTIPKGQYGGGTVMVWDTGTWEPLEGEAAADALRRGSLKFALHGTKLRGGWSLVRTRGTRTGERRDMWLLIKRKDAAAASHASVTDTKPLSAKSGRDLDQIASGVHGHPRSNSATLDGSATPAKRARKSGSKLVAALKPKRLKGAVVLDPARVTGALAARTPPSYSPQLCVLADRVPEGDQWVHEVKFDGYRFLAHCSKTGVRLLSRRDLDWTARFSPIVDALMALSVGDAVIDGEVAVIDDGGRTSFQALQQAIKGQKFDRLFFYAFDLLYLEGYDLTQTPLLARKELLRAAISEIPVSRVKFSDHVTGGGHEVHVQACRLGLEGIVSKRADAPYSQRRASTWLKIKCGLRQEFVVVGYTDPEGGRSSFGSLILAVHDGDGGLVHTGRVGTGFDDALLKDIAARWKPRKSSPLAVKPALDQIRGVHWVEPELVVEVAFSQWTEDGRLRHPSFQGLREDKDPGDVVIERPKRAALVGADLRLPDASPAPPTTRRSVIVPKPVGAAEVEGVVISHPGRVLYPEASLTKLDLVRYHEEVGEFSLPFLVNRPLATLRCPSGRTGPCFFQKHIHQTFTAPVLPIRIKEKGAVVEYIGIQSKAGLIKLAQLGVLEIHPWGSKERTIEQPDWLTFDLDPGEGVEFKDVKVGARRVREILAAVGLESFLKTSGGKGLHIVTPLVPKVGWDVAKAFAMAVAQRMSRDEPSRYVANMAKAHRTGKIFVDYLRNGRGATSVAPYSPRARPNAPVSMPISWDELTRLTSPARYTISNAPAYLHMRRKDPWARFHLVRQELPPAR